MTALTNRERWLMECAYLEAFPNQPWNDNPKQRFDDWLGMDAADTVTVAEVLAKDAPSNGSS